MLQVQRTRGQSCRATGAARGCASCFALPCTTLPAGLPLRRFTSPHRPPCVCCSHVSQLTGDTLLLLVGNFARLFVLSLLLGAGMGLASAYLIRRAFVHHSTDREVRPAAGEASGREATCRHTDRASLLQAAHVCRAGVGCSC